MEHTSTRSAWHTMWRVLSHPWTFIFAALCLLISLTSISSSRGSTIGCALGGRRTACRHFPLAEFVDAGDRWLLASGSTTQTPEDAARAADLVSSNAPYVGLMLFTEGRRRGFYAPVEEHHSGYFETIDLRGHAAPYAWPNAAAKDQVHALFSKYVIEEYGRDPALVARASAGFSTTRAILAGHLHNALTLLLLVVITCGGVRGMHRLATLRADDPSRCATCRYPRAGLTTDRCPECGEPWSG